MDRLAPEIISNIISHFYTEGRRDTDHRIAPLAPLAVLCRHWQPLIEAETFRHLRLDEDAFRSTGIPREVLTPRRLSYVRKLVHVFPRAMRFPTRFNQWYANPSFDLALQILFYQLRVTPLDREPLIDLELVIPSVYTYRITDHGDEPEYVEPIRKLPYLPDLLMVRSLKFTNNSFDLEPSPCAFMYIASKMKQLRVFNVTLSCSQSRKSLIHQRVELAKSLFMLPMSIQIFTLTYHQHDDLPDGLLVLLDGEDILTRELRRFTQRKGLKHFVFDGCVEPSIFWPPDSDTSDPRHWPTLKSLIIDMHRVQELACLRAGEPFKKAKRKKNWDRVYAKGGLMNEFYRAAAKCSACMPNAEINDIDFNDKWGRSLKFYTVLPKRYPCLFINGKPGFEIEIETVVEWRKAVEVHNLVLKVHLDDVNDQDQARNAFEPEEIDE
ncbi:hypothetical protein FGSG_09168 [Fusarium graminearum PH-1]|uniref:Chromosome 4, complete genome n=1 Tax=Gibberella zeae (strain ATCC MYA-4620 / CBS 123657 / FGSC 9075 / NRRL 31084 / PH-1) TaxID=229533 RepID=I1RXU2_GIBZE|nr:hypothetical protein FGSG_09168 [Fusarium graminearum PH-1]ESU15702.1 hypothetical protein FGSG_09168 [Fusarium graminearum PH-1]CEF84811.1 unnamed protein product [Fusarium graminearum]|eukprot:XP_011328614.1 hypothetical protein FGSG_09168 [Fusarium graminearum PH-1]